MITLKLRPKTNSRVTLGHPWVYKDEVTEHIKSVQPGFAVCLLNSEGQFLAYGFGNPNSQIAVRVMTRDQNESQFFSEDWVLEKIIQAWQWRFKMGFTESFRVVYSEGDGLSGLIFDRYLTSNQGQIFVFQILSAGFEVLISDWAGFCEKLNLKLNQLNICGTSWDQTSVILKRSEAFWNVENLKPIKLEVVKSAEENLAQVMVLYRSWLASEPLVFETDFLNGQKTGLFLDQSYNIGLAAQVLTRFYSSGDQVKMLDLCCYRGAWSAHLAQALKAKGVIVEADLLDQSDTAAQGAVKNVTPFVQKAQALVCDVMKDFEIKVQDTYDIVISDPPAFAKNKKAHHQALQGYYHLNKRAVKKIKNQGFLIACSCSAVVTEGDFYSILEKVFQSESANPNFKVKCVGTGGHALDHVVLPTFKEGQYLKMFIFFITKTPYLTPQLTAYT